MMQVSNQAQERLRQAVLEVSSNPRTRAQSPCSPKVLLSTRDHPGAL